MTVAPRRQIRQRVASERAVPHGRELALTFRAEDGPEVPAVLLLPDSARAVAGAVLLHGYSSRKEDMSGPVGRVLMAHGIASLAIDLPLHGTRSDPLQAQSARNPVAMMQLWRLGMSEARLALRYLAARSEVDGARLALVGYSMGAYLSVAVAADDSSVRAVVLAAGGDLPLNTPFTAVVRMVADPLKAVRRIAGRPLLMVNGTQDRTVTRSQAERLFEAAREPKEIRWYDAGHRLPREASEHAAAWLNRHFG